MNRSALLVLIIAALGVIGVAYYLNQPRTAGENLDSAGNALSNGNIGDAFQEMGNQTQGEKIQNDIQDAVEAPAN